MSVYIILSPALQKQLIVLYQLSGHTSPAATDDVLHSVVQLYPNDQTGLRVQIITERHSFASVPRPLALTLPVHSVGGTV